MSINLHHGFHDAFECSYKNFSVWSGLTSQIQLRSPPLKRISASSFPESAPKAFSIPLSQVIANDRAYKLQQDALKESRRDCLDLEASILRFRAEKRQFFNGNKALVGSASLTSGLSSPSANSVAPAPMLDAQSQSLSPTLQDNTSRGQRRVRLRSSMDHYATPVYRADSLSSHSLKVHVKLRSHRPQ